jgi:hypothetical protein
MAVTSVIENYEKDLNDTTSERTTSRQFIVTFNNSDNPLQRNILALKARDPNTGLTIPQRGYHHPYDHGMFVIKINVKQSNIEGAFRCIVTCEYSSIINPHKKTVDPLKEKPQVSWTFVTSDEPIDMALARIEPTYAKNVPITNSAEESFDPPITEERSDLVLHYVRNEKHFYAERARKYIGAVNSDRFLGFGPGRAKLAVWEADKIYDDDYGDYYRVTYEIHFREFEHNGKEYGWVRRILDQGFREYITDPIGPWCYREIEDDAGNKISEPAKLDGRGRLLTGNTKNKGVFLIFETKEKKSFSVLDIDI